MRLNIPPSSQKKKEYRWNILNRHCTRLWECKPRKVQTDALKCSADSEGNVALQTRGSVPPSTQLQAFTLPSNWGLLRKGVPSLLSFEGRGEVSQGARLEVRGSKPRRHQEYKIGYIPEKSRSSNSCIRSRSGEIKEKTNLRSVNYYPL